MNRQGGAELLQTGLQLLCQSELKSYVMWSLKQKGLCLEDKMYERGCCNITASF